MGKGTKNLSKREQKKVYFHLPSVKIRTIIVNDTSEIQNKESLSKKELENFPLNNV